MIFFDFILIMIRILARVESDDWKKSEYEGILARMLRVFFYCVGRFAFTIMYELLCRNAE